MIRFGGLFLGFVVWAALHTATAQETAKPALEKVVPVAKPAQSTVELKSARKPGEVHSVEITIEVGGDLTRNQDGKPTPVKMNVNGQVAYDERALPAGKDDAPTTVRAARHYRNATATLRIGDNTLRPSLRPERRLIGVRIDGGATTLFAPSGPLSHDEHDLIDIPGNSLLVDRLLPEKTVSIGDTWTHSDELAGLLVGLDKVNKNDLKSTLVSITESAARVEMAGKVEGSFSGIATSIEVKAKYQFNLVGKQVTWLGLLIRLNRPQGEFLPGVNLVALVQEYITPGQTPIHLTDAALEKTPLDATPEAKRLLHRSADGVWSLAHDRRWLLSSDDREATVLRWIEDGRPIAVCRVNTRPKKESEKWPTPTEFQAGVRESLGDRFEKTLDASEMRHPSGYRAYRMVAAGKEADKPTKWNCYLLADSQGRQVELVVSMSDETAKRLAGEDGRLFEGFRFGDGK